MFDARPTLPAPTFAGIFSSTLPRIFGIAFLAMLGALGAGAQDRILFIGNSFTFGDGGTASVPEIFDRLAQAGGQGEPVVAMRAVGGQDFEFHSLDAETQSMIASQPWTYVVLQNYSTEPTHIVDGSHSIGDHLAYGMSLFEAVMENNPSSKVLLYETWSRAAVHSMISGVSSPTTFASTSEFQGELWTNYILLADVLAYLYPESPVVRLSPVGDAWEAAGGLLNPSDPDFVDLFTTDEYHGNDNGYFLSAAVFYSRIYGLSPEGLSQSPLITSLGLNLTLPASLLEQIAWATVSADFSPNEDTLLFDFGASGSTTSTGVNPNDPVNYWNNVTETVATSSSGTLSGIVTADNQSTSIVLEILDPFAGSNPDGTTSSAAFPVNSARDSLFGNTESFNGLQNVFPSFKLTGLDPGMSYSFTFFASYEGTGDSRETGYLISGTNAGFAPLEPLGNTNSVAVVAGIVPTASGEIIASIAPTGNNQSSHHFTHLGVMKVVAMVLPSFALEFTSQPEDQTVLEGESVDFSASVTGSPPWYVQWFKNGVAIPGANQLMYSIPVADVGMDAARFSVTVRNEISQITSDEVVLRVNSPDHLQSILLDFGDATMTTGSGPSPDDPEHFWNNVTADIGVSDSGVLPDLVAMDNSPTSVSFAMIDRFNGALTSGSGNANIFPVNATQDTLFGNTEIFGGLTNVFPSFKFTGLDATLIYRFKFYAAREGVTDNREAEYTLTGANTKVVTLDASNNVDDTVTAFDVLPTSGGEITVSIGPGSNNNNSSHFTYIGALKVDMLSNGGAAQAVSFLSQPADQEVALGEPATFSVQISGTPPFQVQWKKDGASIPGANQLTYTVPEVTSDLDGAAYAVVVTNSVSQATSNVADLTLLPGALQTLLIDFGDPDYTTAFGLPPDDPASQWNNVTTTIGSDPDGELNNLIDNNGAPSGVDFEILSRFNQAVTSGTTLSTLYPTDAAHDSLFGNTEPFESLGNVFPEFKLTGLNPALHYTMTFYASRDNVTDNRETEFTVTGATTTTSAYNPSNKVDEVLTFADVVPSAGGEITVAMGPGTNNNNASHFTYLGALQIEANPNSSASPLAPAFTLQPVGLTVDSGDSAAFSVAVVGTPPFSIQWYKNGSPISGADGLTFTIPTSSASDAGTYHATVSNSVSSATSASAVLQIGASVTQTMLIDFGDSSVLTIFGSSPNDPDYYWNNVPTTIGTNSSGQLANLVDTGNTATVIDFQMIDAFVGRNPNGSVNSTVFPQNATSDSLYGQSGTVPSFRLASLNPAVNYRLTFYGARASVSDNRETAFQVVGATSTTVALNPSNNDDSVVTISSIAPSTSGELTVTITAGPNNDNSSLFTYLNVMQIDVLSGGGGGSGPQPPAITQHPVSQTVEEGQPVSFSAAVSGTPPFSIQWFEDSTPIPGANQLVYTIPEVTSGLDGAVYTMSATNAVSQVTSNGATLDIGLPSPRSLLIDFGETGSQTSLGTSPDDPLNHWNNVAIAIGTSSTGSLANLVSTTNEATGINLAMISRFNGSNATGTTAASVFAVDATRDTLFGNTETFGGHSNIFPSFKFTDLNPSRIYSFTFYAARDGVSDNREAMYTVEGESTVSVALNASNNINGTASVSSIEPDASGEITISIAPGPNNDNANHFTYLGALKIDEVPAPTGPQPVAIVQQPSNATVVAGQAATFTVGVTGTAPFTVQWSKDGTPIVGADQLSYTTPIATMGMDEAVYAATVSNAVNQVTSNGATLSVNPPPAHDLLIDFGAIGTQTSLGSAPNDPANHWNNVTTGIAILSNGSVANLQTIQGLATPVRFQMLSPFSGSNSGGTTSSTAFVSNATLDSAFGNTEEFGGSSNITPIFKLTGLEPSLTYTFTFFGSRDGVSDNRETVYTAIGLNSGSATLDTANNVNSVATVPGISPTAIGEIEIRLTPGANNDNANHFVYLNAMRVLASGAYLPPDDADRPTPPTNLAVVPGTLTGGMFILTWDTSVGVTAPVEAYEVYRNGVSLGSFLTNSATVSGLVPSTAYGMTVRARDENGLLSLPSEVLRVSTSSISEIDSDGDGIPDAWEDFYGLDKTNSADALQDSDGDGLNNLGEFIAGTNPNVNYEDLDGDGIADDWEIAYGLDPLDPEDANDPTPGDPNTSYYEAYHLGRNPNLGSPFVEVMRANVRLTVLGKGTGTATLTINGVSKNFRFVEFGSAWTEPILDLDPNYTNSYILDTDWGEDYSVQVTTSGITDYIVKAKVQSEVAPRLQPAIELNGAAAEAILKSEISSNNFVLRTGPPRDGGLRFGAIDTSEMPTNRMISFGLGTSRNGQTPGKVVASLGSWHPYSGFAPKLVQGPGLEGVVETNLQLQARVPGGYVEMTRERDKTTLRFYQRYTNEPTTLSSLIDFASAGQIPVATYTIEHGLAVSSSTPTPSEHSTANWAVGSGAGKITRTVAGDPDTTELEFETFRFHVENHNKVVGTQYAGWIDADTVISYFWPWRKSSAPRQGLTKAEFYTYRTVLQNQDPPGPPEYTYQLHELDITRYDGPTEASNVAFHEFRNGPAFDRWMANAHPVTRGQGADYHSVPKRRGGGSGPLRQGPVNHDNGYGGGTITEYLSLPSHHTGANNLDGQPIIAIGQPKFIRQNFENNDLLTSTDLITTYDYKSDPVDGRAVPLETVTTQGSTQIGQTDFSYSTGTFGGETAITTTATSYTDSSNSLTTITHAYSNRLTDLDLRGKPLSITRPDDTKTSFGYQRGDYEWDDADFSDDWDDEPDGEYLRIVEVIGKVGTGTSSFDGLSIDPLTLDPNRSTVSERIIDRSGRLFREATWLYMGGSDFELVNAVYHGYDSLGNLTVSVNRPSDKTPSADDRVFYEASYSGFLKDWEKDASGVKVSYTYDDNSRVETATREASGTSGQPDYIAPLVTTYAYDAIGRLETETVSSPGETDELVTGYTYDTAGRLASKTLPGGFTTSTSYQYVSNGSLAGVHNQKTTTNPDGGTVVEYTLRDGRKSSVTGTVVADVTYDYEYDASGYLNTTETLSSGVWTKTITDWKGRVDRVVSPTFDGGADREVVNIYNASGQLVAQHTMAGSTKLLPTSLFGYDTFGRLQYEATDSNNNNQIDFSQDLNAKQHYWHYENSQYGIATQSEWFLYQTELIWPYDQDDEGGTADRSGEWRSAWQTYTQISGLTDNIASHVYSADFDRNWTVAHTAVDRTDRKSESFVTTAGTTETIREVYLNGMLVESENAQGHVGRQSYDGLGRLKKIMDPRIGALDSENGWTQYAYLADSALVASVTSPDGKATTFAYDGVSGRLVSEKDNANKFTYYDYDLMGNVIYTWGDVPNPVRYVFNELGQRTNLYTYQTGSWDGAAFPTAAFAGGNETTWTYQSSTGLLTSKTDADDKTTSFQYDDAGRMSKRTDARGWVTDYTYFGQGDAGSGAFNGQLKLIDYQDAYTTDVSYTYHRSGKVKTVIDAAGTRTFNYYESWTNTSYDAELRNKSGQLQSESFLSFLGGSAVSVDYDYQYSVSGRANSPLASIQINGSGTTYDAAYAYDSAFRLGEVSYKSFTPIDYAYLDDSNLVDTLTQSTGGGAFDYKRDYDYETYSNRLQTMKHAWSTTPAKAVETRLTYDTRGMRETEKTKGTNLMSALSRPSEGVHADFSYDDRYQVDESDKYQLQGSGSWDVGSALADTGREYVYDPIGNRTSDQDGSYSSNNLNQYTSSPTSGSYTYDNNGNILTGLGRTFTYDGENRVRTVAIIVSGNTHTFTYEYDYLGRRISKSGTGISETRFIYDGWNLIAELNSSNTVIRKYVWGSDVSGSMQGAGGVGGLFMIEDGSEQYYPIYDASHNVIGLYDSSGNTDAAYEYDPFGKTVASGGAYANTNPFRYSTKYTDNETGLVYYGMRFYDPQIGRFLNRDPIEESGGLNLYGFVGNNGVNGYDYLGMADGDENLPLVELEPFDVTPFDAIGDYNMQLAMNSVNQSMDSFGNLSTSTFEQVVQGMPTAEQSLQANVDQAHRDFIDSISTPAPQWLVNQLQKTPRGRDILQRLKSGELVLVVTSPNFILDTARNPAPHALVLRAIHVSQLGLNTIGAKSGAIVNLPRITSEVANSGGKFTKGELTAIVIDNELVGFELGQKDQTYMTLARKRDFQGMEKLEHAAQLSNPIVSKSNAIWEMRRKTIEDPKGSYAQATANATAAASAGGSAAQPFAQAANPQIPAGAVIWTFK